MLTRSDNDLAVHTGPGTPMGKVFRSFFLPVLLSEELPEPDCPPVRVTILGECLVAFRDSDGIVGLLEDRCPHRGAALFFGRNEECGLRCTYHGWKFDRTGACVDMPNEPPESTFKQKVKATAYAVAERGGVVWACLGTRADDEPTASVPDLEWAVVPESHRYITKVYVNCNYLQSLEGDIDSSHSAFLHGRLDNTMDLGSSDSVYREDLRGYSFSDRAPRFFTVQTDNGAMVGARREAGSDQYYWRITQWMLPSYSLIPKEDGALLQCNMRIPADDEHHWFFRTMYRPSRPLTDAELHEFRNGGNLFQALIPGTYLPTQTLENDFLIDREAQSRGGFSGIKGIPAQDQSVTVTMGPINDRTREHLGTADAGIIAARRRLIESALLVESGGTLAAPAMPEKYLIRAPALLLDRSVAFDVGAADRVNAPQLDIGGARRSDEPDARDVLA